MLKKVKILQTGFLKLKFEIILKNHIFQFCQTFLQAIEEVESFFCHFLNPWALRLSGMGCYTSKKCEKKPKSLHPNVRAGVRRPWTRSHVANTRLTCWAHVPWRLCASTRHWAAQRLSSSTWPSRVSTHRSRQKIRQ